MPGIVEVAPAGDIILQLENQHRRASPRRQAARTGDGNDNDYDNDNENNSNTTSNNEYQAPPTFRVSSAVLSVASPVFRAMLGPAFLEGAEFRSSQARGEPYTLVVHEDDRAALGLLLDMLHFRLAGLEKTPTASCLEQLAFACDKYQCAGVVRAQGYVWLRDAVTRAENMPMQSLARLLVFAYVADLRQAFAEIGWQLFVRSRGPLRLNGQLSMLEDHVLFKDDDVLGFLDGRRKHCCQALSDALAAPFSAPWSLGDPSRGCRSVDANIPRHIHQLRISAVDLFQHDDFRQMEFARLFAAARRLPLLYHDAAVCVHDPCRHADRALGREFREASARIESWRANLMCLNCLKGRKKSRYCGEACMSL